MCYRLLSAYTHTHTHTIELLVLSLYWHTPACRQVNMYTQWTMEEHLVACLHTNTHKHTHTHIHTCIHITQLYTFPCRDFHCHCFSTSTTLITNTLSPLSVCPLFSLLSVPKGYPTRHMSLCSNIMGLPWGWWENASGFWLKLLHPHEM